MSTNDVPVLGKRSADETVEELEAAIEATRLKVKKTRSTLKPKGSFESSYWDKAVNLTTQQMELNELELDKAKVRHFADGGSAEDFHQTDIFRNRTEAIKNCERKRDICKRQLEKVSVGGSEVKALARSFMELFTSSSLGLNVKESARGDRDSQLQSAFRQDIIKYYNLQHPGGKQYEDLLWNVVTAEYEPSSNLVASHIFSWKHGKATMGATFGADKADELFSAQNGLLLPKWLEEQFDNGFLTIRPDIDDFKNKEAVNAWEISAEKPYKLHIVDKKRDMVDKIAYLKPQTFWRELDGKTLSFKTDARPRARYLYFHDMCQHIRLAWRRQGESLNTMLEENGKFCWGTWGRYIARNQMRTLMDEVGHESRDQDEVGDPALDQSAEPDNLKLTLINQIEYTNRVAIQEREEDEDEDEAENSEEEEPW